MSIYVNHKGDSHINRNDWKLAHGWLHVAFRPQAPAKWYTVLGICHRNIVALLRITTALWPFGSSLGTPVQVLFPWMAELAHILGCISVMWWVFWNSEGEQEI